MTRKLCGGCLRLRDYSEFQKSHTRPGGLQSMCRECRSRRDREHRQGRREKGQKRLFPEDSCATRGDVGSKFPKPRVCPAGTLLRVAAPPRGKIFPAVSGKEGGALENSCGPGVGTVVLPAAPDKPADAKTQGKCHYRVRRAIALGVLSRPPRCTICRRSREEAGRLVAHHEDYTNPLSVVFLCQSCHEIVHGQKESLCLL